MSQIDDFDSPLGGDAGSVWLNDLFESARLPGTTEELASEAEVVGAMVHTIAQPPLVSDLGARRISKAAVRTAIAAAVLLVGTSTAAATGNLPDGAQSAVARATSHLGVDIPDPYDDRAAEQPDSSGPTTVPTSTSTMLDAAAGSTVPANEVRATGDAAIFKSSNSSPSASDSADSPDPQSVPPVTSAGRGPDADGPAKQGLCRAWAAHRDDSPANQNSTAMKNLQAAAAAVGQTVAEFCADVLGPEPAAVETTVAEPTPTTAVDGQGNNDKAKDNGNEKDQEKDKEKKPKGGS